MPSQRSSEFSKQDEPRGLVIQALSPDTWENFQALFEGRGGPKTCWCMVWRDQPKSQTDVSGQELKKATMKERVLSGVPQGLVGFLEGSPVAWCSVAPKTTFRKLTETADAPTDNVWSIVCFYVQRAAQGQGFQRLLLQAAMEYARTNGGTSVEAYPVERDSPSYRFMGFTDLFESAGFTHVGNAGTRRRVYRKSLS